MLTDLRGLRIRVSRLKSDTAVEGTGNIGAQDMKVLNVAEKNDAAKGIAGYLSRGSSRRVTINFIPFALKV